MAYLPDLNKREYSILLVLVLFAVILGIYPSIILDSLHYATSSLLYGFDYTQNYFHYINLSDLTKQEFLNNVAYPRTYVSELVDSSITNTTQRAKFELLEK